MGLEIGQNGATWFARSALCLEMDWIEQVLEILLGEPNVLLTDTQICLHFFGSLCSFQLKKISEYCNIRFMRIQDVLL